MKLDRLLQRAIAPRTMLSAEVARMAGVTPRTLYQWLADGLVDEPARTPRGYRIWTPEEIRNVVEFSKTRHAVRRAA